MPFNWLLLPLLGGYIFLTRLNRTRFLAERSEGYRFLVEIAIAGTLLLFFSALVIRLFFNQLFFIDRWWHYVVPYPSSGITALSFLLAYVLPLIGNRIWSVGSEVQRAIQLKGSSLELLFHKAQHSAEAVLVIMTDGKVYVGFISRLSSKSLSLLPVRSGYQDQEYKEVHFTTNYARILETLEARGTAKDMSDLTIALPLREVTSARIFNERIHELFTGSALPDEDEGNFLMNEQKNAPEKSLNNQFPFASKKVGNLITQLKDHIVQIEAMIAYLLISLVLLSVVDSLTEANQLHLPFWLIPSILLLGLRQVVRVTNPNGRIRNALVWAATIGGVAGAVVGAATDILSGGLTGGQGTLIGIATGSTIGGAAGNWIESWGKKDELLERGKAFEYLYTYRQKNPKVANPSLINTALDDPISSFDINDDGRRWYTRDSLNKFLNG